MVTHLTAKAELSVSLSQTLSSQHHHHQCLLLHQGTCSRVPDQALCPQHHVFKHQINRIPSNIHIQAKLSRPNTLSITIFFKQCNSLIRGIQEVNCSSKIFSNRFQPLQTRFDNKINDMTGTTLMHKRLLTLIRIRRSRCRIRT